MNYQSKITDQINKVGEIDLEGKEHQSIFLKKCRRKTKRQKAVSLDLLFYNEHDYMNITLMWASRSSALGRNKLLKMSWNLLALEGTEISVYVCINVLKYYRGKMQE